MVVKNLEFFDKDGYNLNLNWNEQKEIWEGNIFFPKSSVGYMKIQHICCRICIVMIVIIQMMYIHIHWKEILFFNGI